MKSKEARDLGAVSGRTLRAVTEVVRGAHFTVSDAVGDAVRAAVGPVATPVRVVQDAMTHSIYSLTGLGLSVASRAAGLVAESRMRELDASRTSVHDGGAHLALGIGLGLAGDRVVADAASLAPAMHVRRAGRPVSLTPDEVAAAFGDATGQVAVLVHGLFEDESAWAFGADRRAPYADRLAGDLGMTPVLLRFNTGLRVSDNGRALADLLADLVAAWPVPPARIVLVGHSMGGLVIHSALAQADAVTDTSSTWLPLVRDTVTLGTPHHGSPIARAVDRAAWRLATSARTRWAGDAFGIRSGGIRDMAHGNVIAADWLGHDAHDHADHRTHPEPAAGIRHHAVVGVAGSRLPTAVGELVGDVVVPLASASHAEIPAVGRRFGEEDIAVVTGVTHLGLLNHDAVYSHLHRWLAEG